MRCANCGNAVLAASTINREPTEGSRGDALTPGRGSCERCGALIAADRGQRAFNGAGHSRLWMAPSSSFGYIVAISCVMSAGLILVLVYFMAIGLEGNGTVDDLGRSRVLVVGSGLPSRPTEGIDVTAVASATASDVSGSGLITEAVTASGVDTTGLTQGGGAAAIGPTSTFRVGQRVYLVLHLHPAGQLGSVCLLWYLNGKETSQLELAISAGETTAYSYAIYNEAGAGSVDVYWASRGDCGDRSLARHVEFAVTS